VADLLTSQEFGGDGLFDRRVVAATWQRFLRSQASEPLLIWALVMFEGWRRYWRAQV
jgi:hypothetical protein